MLCVCVLCSGAGAIKVDGSLTSDFTDGDTALIIRGDATFASNSEGGEGGEIHLLRGCDPAVSADWRRRRGDTAGGMRMSR